MAYNAFKSNHQPGKGPQASPTGPKAFNGANRSKADDNTSSRSHMELCGSQDMLRGMMMMYQSIFVFWLAVNAWLWSLIEWEQLWELKDQWD